MLTYDRVSNLQFYPALPMARFGTTPYGDNKYRVVFNPSRRHLVCGTWPDGSNCAKYVKKYFQIGDVWILERWLPASEYARMSKEQWNRDCLILGPYPDRGEYEFCYEFDPYSPSDCNLDKLIAWIEMGRDVRLADKVTFARKDSDRERKEISNQMEDKIRNALPAFGTCPMSGFGGGRSQKTAPILKTAEELGLPTSGGKLRTKHRPDRPKFEVPLEI